MNILSITSGSMRDGKPLNRHRLARILVTVSLILIAWMGNAHCTVFIPLSDQVYEFLDNCAARGLIPLTVRMTRPITREMAAGYLLELVEKYARIEDRIIEADLDYYLREFAPEVNELSSEKPSKRRRLRPVGIDISDALSNPHWHLSTFDSDDFRFVFDPVIWVQIDGGLGSTYSKTVFRRCTGIQFRGEFEDLFGFYFRFVDHVERGARSYTSRWDLFEDKYAYVGRMDGGSEVSYDLSEAYLARKWKAITLIFGRDKFRWGPGQVDQLMFSGAFPSIDHLRLRIDLYEKASFTYVLGKLNPWLVPGEALYTTEEGWTRKIPTQKWLSAHRIEYQPREWLVLAVNEAVVWGERGLDIAYLNPLNFLFSAEHNGGDVDNVLMSGDFTLRLKDYGIVYGSLLIDDLSLSTLGEGNPGNKIGLMAGARIYDIWIDGAEFGVEYTRLEPYVYSHFYPVNRFTTWTSSLGSAMLPNSDRLEARLKLRPSRSIKVNLIASINRHGSKGGDVYQTVEKGVYEKVKFLEGLRKEWSMLDVSVSWEPVPGIQTQIGIVSGDTQKVLPDRYYVSIGYRY